LRCAWSRQSRSLLESSELPLLLLLPLLLESLLTYDTESDDADGAFGTPDKAASSDDVDKHALLLPNVSSLDDDDES